MTWDDLLKKELQKPYFQSLIQFLKAEDENHLIFPPKDERLACFKLTPYQDVKVVILGQDPYHDHHQAHGLSFSVKQGKYPPSLLNIFKELVDDCGISYPKTGNLTAWAKQGVLLLNTCLTVRAHQPLSHQNKGWETYTVEVIKTLNDKKDPVVFILWGAHAQKCASVITNPHHRVLKSAHPSPLSASRGFFGSKPFTKTNQFLISQGLDPIDWRL